MTRLEQIRKRLEAATPGPWKFYYDDAEPEWIVVHTYLKETREFGGADEQIPATGADAELICHSPQDLRDLLAVVGKAVRVRDVFYALSDSADTPLHNAIAEMDVTMQKTGIFPGDAEVEG